MKTALAKSKCPCGAQIEAMVFKPKPFQPSISKCKCESCGSRFLLKSELNRHDAQGKMIFKSRFEILELSQKAKDILFPRDLEP